MKQITDAIMDHRDVEIVESGEDVARYSRLGFNDGMILMDWLDRRRNVRPEPQADIIVVLDEWVTYDTYDIADSSVVIASKIEDSSQKAYNVRGAWWFDTSMFNKHLDVAREAAVNEQVSRIDRTNTEYVNRVGETYLPKKAVDAVLFYEEG